MLIVGNKCDNEEIIGVPTNLAQRFADSHNMPLFETSAKDDEKRDHVEAIFLTLAHKINANKLLFKSKDDGRSPQAAVVRVEEPSVMDHDDSGSCCF